MVSCSSRFPKARLSFSNVIQQTESTLSCFWDKKHVWRRGEATACFLPIRVWQLQKTWYQDRWLALASTVHRLAGRARILPHQLPLRDHLRPVDGLMWPAGLFGLVETCLHVYFGLIVCFHLRTEGWLYMVQRQPTEGHFKYKIVPLLRNVHMTETVSVCSHVKKRFPVIHIKCSFSLCVWWTAQHWHTMLHWWQLWCWIITHTFLESRLVSSVTLFFTLFWCFTHLFIEMSSLHTTYPKDLTINNSIIIQISLASSFQPIREGQSQGWDLTAARVSILLIPALSEGSKHIMG